MYEGEVEVSWCYLVTGEEVLLAFRIPDGGALAQLKQGDRVHLSVAASRVKRTRGVSTEEME